MAKINNIRELMHYCCEVNCEYMRLPAGNLANYQTLSALYQRIADQSLLCAGTWLRDHECPDHEPAVDAFWWAVVAWAGAFGTSVGMEPVEWGREFIYPHCMFANYLKPGPPPGEVEPHAGLPAETILELDVRWMKLVMKLTASWGFLHHMKDMQALHEAQHLEKELRAPDGTVRDAYLRSDLKFFQALFLPFPFKSETKQQLRDWLAMADPDNK
jgi:hypothetical protein